MSDEVDMANMQVELNEKRSIAYAQALASTPIPKSDHCLWCNSKTIDGRRWCNADCRDMWTDFGEQ